jgi:hypothetical protein
MAPAERSKRVCSTRCKAFETAVKLRAF